MSAPLPLSNTVTLVAELRERIKEDFGFDDGESVLEDTLAGETDLHEQLTLIARKAIETEAFAEALGEVIKASQTRKARIEHRAEKLRDLIKWAMSESGTRCISAPDMTLGISSGKAPLVIPDDDDVPEPFCRIKLTPDKDVIRQCIKDGEDLPFARLGNASMTLTIRRG